MALRHVPVIVLGRLVRIAARLRKRGGGSAVPGLVVNQLAPGYLPSALASFPQGLVVVSGTAGKSTTTKLLVAVLEAHGLNVFTNPSTANIAQGLTSALLERSTLTGRVDADIAVLEMDEGHGAFLAPKFEARVVLLTNVMTDQIDRFYDSERVAQLLETIARRASETVVTNGDDAHLEELAGRLDPAVNIERFGVAPAVLDSQPRGLGYARLASGRVDDGAIVTESSGRDAVVELDGDSLAMRVPAKGVHFAVDAAAAVLAARSVLGMEFDPQLSARTVSLTPPVFGRGEVVRVRGVDVEFVLVQNTSSFQLNVDMLDPDLDQVLIAMGSDVRDPGYFWPVDARRLSRVRYASGSKAFEIALQLAYQGVAVDAVEPDLAAALDAFLALPEPATGVKTIVFTADSMRRTRTILGIAA